MAYIVTWEIDDFDSKSPKEAAEKALETMRDKDSCATRFDVTEEDGTHYDVDLFYDTVELSTMSNNRRKNK